MWRWSFWKKDYQSKYPKQILMIYFKEENVCGSLSNHDQWWIPIMCKSCLISLALASLPTQQSWLIDLQNKHIIAQSIMNQWLAKTAISKTLGKRKQWDCQNSERGTRWYIWDRIPERHQTNMMVVDTLAAVTTWSNLKPDVSWSILRPHSRSSQSLDL